MKLQVSSPARTQPIPPTRTLPVIPHDVVPTMRQPVEVAKVSRLTDRFVCTRYGGPCVITAETCIKRQRAVLALDDDRTSTGGSKTFGYGGSPTASAQFYNCKKCDDGNRVASKVNS